MKVIFLEDDFNTPNPVLAAMGRSIIPVDNPNTSISGGGMYWHDSVPFTVSRGIYSLGYDLGKEAHSKIQKREPFEMVVPDPIIMSPLRHISLANSWLI